MGARCGVGLVEITCKPQFHTVLVIFWRTVNPGVKEALIYSTSGARFHIGRLPAELVGHLDVWIYISLTHPPLSSASSFAYSDEPVLVITSRQWLPAAANNNHTERWRRALVVCNSPFLSDHLSITTNFGRTPGWFDCTYTVIFLGC